MEKMYAISGRIKIQKGDILAGKYRYIKKLGMGGMGAVCLVCEIQTNQMIAMKYCLSDKHMDRFEREVLAWLQLGDHPNIVSAIYFDHINNKPTLFIEYIKGETLKEVINKSAKENKELHIEKILDYAIQLSRGMEHLHSRGVIHRDLNPKNIIIKDEENGFGIVKITDMGLSKLKVLPKKSESTKMSGRHLASKIELTEINQVLGTPQYMSPQQYTSSKEVNESTDIYAFGLVLYEMISCGKFPFIANSTTGWLHAHLYRTPRHIKKQATIKVSFFQHKTRNELYNLVMNCLAKENKERPESFTAIEKILESIYERLCKKSYRRSKISPTSLSIWEKENNRAISLLNIGAEHLKEVQTILTKIHQQKPKFLLAHLNLLLLKLKTKEFSFQEFWLEANDLLQKTSYDAKVMDLMVGAALEKHTYMQKSLQLLMQIQNISDYPNLERKKAKWLYLKGDYSSASQIFNTLCQKESSISDDFYNYAGSLIHEEILSGSCQVVSKIGKFSLNVSATLRQQIWDILRRGEKKCGSSDAIEKAKDIVAGGEVPKMVAWHEYGHLIGHKKLLKKVLITADGKKIISVDKDNYVKLWNVKTRSQICEWKLQEKIISIAISLEFRYMALGLENGSIFLYDLFQKKLISSMHSHKSPVIGLSFCERDQSLVSCEEIGKINKWKIEDIMKKKKIWQLSIKTNSFYCLDEKISSICTDLSGDLIIAGSQKGNVYFISCHENKPSVIKMKAHTKEVKKILISANGRAAVSMSVSPPHNILLWDLRNKEKIHFSQENASSIAITGDAKFILVAIENGCIDIWNTSKKSKIFSLEGHSNLICDISVTADSTMAVSGFEDGLVTLWANDYVWPLQVKQDFFKSCGI